MKLIKKIISFILVLFLIANFSTFASISAFAHSTMLNIEYDPCNGQKGSDGADEMWYVLERDGINRHISHEVETVRYYFADTTDWIPFRHSDEVGEEIKETIANSIEKWNNVYFYSYNADGTITKNKLINLEQVTSGPYELLIAPDDGIMNPANTQPNEPTSSDPGHYHYSSWIMNINVEWFVEDIYQLTAEEFNWVKETVGAHEFGHVLGLRDVDYIYRNNNNANICGSDLGIEHHSELLMGYTEQDLQNPLDITYSSPNITYKDIAGVAITRGFHTDEDHRWLTTGALYDGKYKLICSICNGVKYVENLADYPHDMYMYCELDHELSDGNMMAVASYGNKDYYKCKYCRYVAPFSEIVDQNYSKICCSTDYHKCVNTVGGLEYTFYEPHTLVDGECTECTSHEYGKYMYFNKFSHKRTCACGKTQTSAHYISGSHVGEDFVPCGGCGYLLDMRDNIYEGIMSITQVSVNGSYIRSDGIVVLVDEDIEAYLAGTLQFYHPEDVPVTQ